MEQTKDYSLLRPFDLEAAKTGEKICYYGFGQPLVYISGPDSNREHVVLDQGMFQIYTENLLRMAPLAWVEGKPVYKGDVLYWNRPGYHKFIATTLEGGYISGECDSYDNNKPAGMLSDTLTWNPPKVKREGWVNIVKYDKDCYYGEIKDRIVRNCDIFPSFDAANSWAGKCKDVIATVRIEWEE